MTVSASWMDPMKVSELVKYIPGERARPMKYLKKN
jgi:hypothetical protein